MYSSGRIVNSNAGLIACCLVFGCAVANAAAPTVFESLRASCANETARTTAEIVAEGKKQGTPVDQTRLQSPAALYMAQVQTEACTHKKLKDQLEDNMAKVCGAKQSALDCVYSQVHARAHVTAGLSMSQVLLVYAGLRDQARAADKDVAGIQLADKLMRVVEEAKPESFYLANARAENADAATELASLRTQDEVQFGSTVNKTLSTVEKSLSEIAVASTARTALEKWKADAVNLLRVRLAKLKAKEWHYK